MQGIKIDDTLSALFELVSEKELTPMEATKEWMKESGKSLAYAVTNGVLEYFQSAPSGR